MSCVRSSGGEFDAQYPGWRGGWVRSLRQLQNPRRHLPRVRQLGAGSASGGVGSGKALLPRGLAFGQCPLPQRGMTSPRLWQANSGTLCAMISRGTAGALFPRPTGQPSCASGKREGLERALLARNRDRLDRAANHGYAMAPKSRPWNQAFTFPSNASSKGSASRPRVRFAAVIWWPFGRANRSRLSLAS
jgi:hypothetical protein